MWTEITRRKYARAGLRYASDLTDGEWAQLERFLPCRRPTGRPRTTALREVVNAISYLLRTGCPWRFLPGEFPPRSTVQRYFYAWRDDGTWVGINYHLMTAARAADDRAACPSAGIIDSQSAATTESGGPRGLDAAKRVKGRKRHIVTDTAGHLLVVNVHPANIQDCHGAEPLLRELRRSFPDLHHIFADRVYRGPQLRNAVADCGPWTIEIVQRPPGRQRLPAAAPTLGRGAHLRLARKMPTPRKGLRKTPLNRTGMDLHRRRPAPDTTTGKSLITCN